jgi:hypothetical protein
LDENIRNGYGKIKVSIKIKADVSKEKLQELGQLAQKRSPVFNIVSHPMLVELIWRNRKYWILRFLILFNTFLINILFFKMSLFLKHIRTS